MSRRGTKERKKEKKPFYKKIWQVIIILILIAAIAVSCGKKEETASEPLGIDKYNISVSNVLNDVTGNWKKATIAENIEMQDYAVDYYKKFFENDNQIHAVINFNYNTTTKISVMGNLLDVTVYDYVDKEEHDANTLFTGTLLKEYHVNIDSGEIEEII